MKKKILVTGPVLSRSGYGEMARLALKALKSREDLYDIYVSPTNWGHTGSIFKETTDIKWIKKLISKTEQILSLTKNTIKFDLSLQVTIPNEWKKLAAKNIGYTAGIETNFISPAWLDPSNSMDKIVTISEHSKSSFTNTVFGDKHGNQFRVNTPVSVAHFPVKRFESKEELNLDLHNDFNFLTVCQWGPRKNLEQLIVAFVEEFRNESVGLVVKTNTANDSIMDKEATYSRMTNLVNSLGNKKCSIHLVHGTMSEQEIDSLYSNPKIKAFVTATHGEGYCIPAFEASYNGMPVIATDWSGHLDFLTIPESNNFTKKMFAAVECEVRPIEEAHVWPGVLEKGTSWAFPKQTSLRVKMRDVYKDYSRFKGMAKKLAEHNIKTFSEDNVYSQFLKALEG